MEILIENVHKQYGSVQKKAVRAQLCPLPE